jgi:hypothetical protein
MNANPTQSLRKHGAVNATGTAYPTVPLPVG